MLKLIQPIIVATVSILSIANCTGEKTTKYYGVLKQGISKLTKYKTLDEFDSFSELCDTINSILCKNERPAIQFYKNNSKIIVALNGICKDKIHSRHLRPRNTLSIIDDTIKTYVNYHIDSLEQIMKRHYSNFGKSPFYAETPSRFFIRITYKENNLSKLKYLLGLIINNHDKMNSSNVLGIELYITNKPPKPPLRDKSSVQ